MNIYESGVGDALIDPAVYTPAIRDYLAGERAFVMKCPLSHDALVEAGCSAGRYAADVLNSGRKYMGIDRVARYISEGKRRYPEAVFITADICGIAGILLPHLRIGLNPLIVVPFNLIGTLDDARLFLSALFLTGCRFALFRFNATAVATAARTDYYTTSGFRDLQCAEPAEGTLFTTTTGLHSFAYTTAWFEERFSEADVPIYKAAIGNIGTAYSNF